MEPFDQLNPRPNPIRPQMPLGKVMLYNFGAMVCYMLLTSLMGTGHDRGMSVLAADAMLVLAQVGLNLLVGFVLVFTEEHKQLGGAMLIAGVLMGIIGFGGCLAHASLMGNM